MGIKNKVQLIGNVGREPSTTELENGRTLKSADFAKGMGNFGKIRNGTNEDPAVGVLPYFHFR